MPWRRSGSQRHLAMTDSQAIGTEPCPECRKNGGDSSGDNLVRYDDGHGYCFACGYHEHGDSPSPSKEKRQVSTNGEVSNREFKALPKRRITEETCRFFGYQCGTYNDKPVQIARYIRDGKVVAEKVRFKNKDFKFLGTPKESGLYGQHLWRHGGKRLIITEGEIDALTISQLQQNNWPVVSVPNGAAGAAKSIAREIEWISSFETVVFAFDMDEAGSSAAQDCARLLEPGKARVAHLPAKDANDCLLGGLSKELVQSLWEAKPFRPDGLVDVQTLVSAASAPVAIGEEWPWPGMSKTYGRRRKELYGFGGGTGCGKTTVFKEVALHCIQHGATPVGLLFLEEPPAHTLRTLAGMAMGQRVHVPGVEYDEEELREAVQAFTDKVYLYDHFGAATFDTILDRIRYMAHALGVRDVFLDHLTALAASVESHSERIAIDKMMAELASLAQELDITIYFISHLATPDGKPHEEGGRVFEKHFRGSRSIGYWSHFLFGIERDKQDTEGVITFRILKDRYTGDSAGVTFGLNYNRNTGRLEECELPDRNTAADHGFAAVTDEF